jgi:glycosyltransferase involved in cell wall biosynthesis
VARILQVFRPLTGGTYAHVRVLSEFLAAKGYEVAACGPPGVGFPVPLIPAAIPRAGSPVSALAAVRDVGRAYRSFEPDLIHAHGAQAGVVSRLARPARPEAALVHTPHRYAFEDGAGSSWRNRAYRAMERALMPATTAVICVCDHERGLARELGAGDRAHVVHNGVETVPDAPVPEAVAAFAAGGDRLLVAVSELFRRKGVEVLAEAMAILASSHPGARLVVAGDGPDRAACEAAIRSFGVTDRILLSGHVDGVGGLLRAADVFVNPALAEGLPYAVLEAMSIGSACLVTDAGGTPEAIEDGRSGIVVPRGDAAALAAAAARLLDDPELRSELGAAARERMRTHFTRDRMLADTLAIYEQLELGPGQAGVLAPT